MLLLLLRQESLKQAERERRMKYKKQDDEREVIRSSIRDKVGVMFIVYTEGFNTLSKIFSTNLRNLLMMKIMRM